MKQLFIYILLLLCTSTVVKGQNKQVTIVTTVTTTGQPTVKTYTDLTGKKLREKQQRFDGQYLNTDYVYDTYGRLVKTSMPYKGSIPVGWDENRYDSLDRVTRTRQATGKIDIYTYNPLSVTERRDNVIRTLTKDVSGKTICVEDTAGTITYTYRPDGQPDMITAPGKVITSFEYDKYGRQNKITDPSAGTKTFMMDDVKRLYTETDALGKVIKTTYDAYGRTKKKEIVGESTTDYVYDADGLLADVITKNTDVKVIHSKELRYDAYMRPYTEKETIVDGKWLQKTFAYANGNVSSVLYDSNAGSIVTENYSYTNGHNTEIKLNNMTSIWKLTTENDMGLTKQATTGILTRTYGYDAYGIPNARVIKNGTTAIQDFGYNFDVATGNLNWRKDNNRNIQENFLYDELNRLTHFGEKKMMSYDIKGNITDYAGVGKFDYTNTTKPYAVTEISPYGTEIPLPNQAITYNGMMRPSLITEDIYSADFIYNTDGDRLRMQIKKNNTVDLTRYYIGGQYEFETGIAGVKEKLYLDGDAYSAAAVYVKEGTGAWQIYHIGRDYLGSITHIIDATGAVKQELSYDVWGRLRNPVNQQLYAIGSEPALFLARGYTGHEHLPMFGLINMNARLYDPVIGRFLSPDPYVEAPSWSQNFNRFSYALNNPLRYNDPSGKWFGIDDALIAGSGFIVGYLGYGLSSGNWGGKALAAGAMGAAGSWLGYNLAGLATGAITKATWNTMGSMAINAAVNQIMPPMNIPISENFGITASPAFGWGAAGFSSGVNMGAYYTDGDFSIGGSLGAGDNYTGWNANATYKGYGAGYGRTNYAAGEVMGKQFEAQKVGTYTAFFNYNSFSISNDLWGDKGDRQRTSAAELNIGRFSVGTYIYTNDGREASNGEIDRSDNCIPPWPVGLKKSGNRETWKNGRPYFAPAWIGYRNGNQITRIGFSHKVVHNLTQNMVHKYMSTPYYMSYDEFRTGGYYYSGFYNPLSLWDR